MPKSNFFTGQPILNQLLSFIPRSMVAKICQEHQADYYCKQFKAYDHLVTMLFSSFHRCSSIRELVTGLQAHAHRLIHLGIKQPPKRSTLSDANKRRSEGFFKDVFHALYKYHYGILPDSVKDESLINQLFIIDSTTISLFSTVMKGAGVKGLNGRKKGGAKANVLMRARDAVPCLVNVTQAARSDRKFMEELVLTPYSIVVMDKGYVNYHIMKQWTLNKITWVTRLTENAKWELLENKPITEDELQAGVREDHIIQLGNLKTNKKSPVQKARIVTFCVTDTGKQYQFLTNNLSYPASTIAALYKKRWSIELLFKRVKQNFQLYDFLGDNENAIKIQIWCALIADLLIKIVKDKSQKAGNRMWSFSNLSGLIRLHLYTYIDLFKFLSAPEQALRDYKPPGYQQQLVLF